MDKKVSNLGTSESRSSLLFADDVGVFSCYDLQRAQGRFVDWDESLLPWIPGLGSNLKKVECSLLVTGESLLQAKWLKHLGVLFTSDCEMVWEMDPSRASPAVIMTLAQSLMIKELSLKAKLLIYWTLYNPAFTNGHEIWTLTKNIRSWIQVAGLYLRWGVWSIFAAALRRKESCRHLIRMPSGHLSLKVFQARLTGRRFWIGPSSGGQR